MLIRILLTIFPIAALWSLSLQSIAATIDVQSKTTKVMWATCAGPGPDVKLHIQLSGSSAPPLVLSRDNRLIKDGILLGSENHDPCSYNYWVQELPNTLAPLANSLEPNGALAAWKDGETLFILVPESTKLLLYIFDTSMSYPVQYLLLAERPFETHFTESHWREVKIDPDDKLRAFGKAGFLIEDSTQKLILKQPLGDWKFDGNPSDLTPVALPLWYKKGGSTRFVKNLTFEQLVATTVLSPEARESASGVVPSGMVALPLPQNPILFLPGSK